jgi:hypothetical protein
MTIRLRSFLVLLIVAILATTEIALHAAHSQTVEPPTDPELIPVLTKPVRRKEELVPAILACLAINTEALLFDDHIDCMHYRKAHHRIEKNKAPVPQLLKFNRFCARDITDSQDPRDADKTKNKIAFSARVLTSEMIATLIHANVSTQGVRILGAVFCDSLDIVGLDLTSSLVIDHSLFKNGIEIRNIQIRGDLSFDNSFVFNKLKILRSKINGSIYGDAAFIDRLEITNSTIDGSVSLGESVLFHSTEFDNVIITRELNIRGSALSYLIVQFSKISGLLDLSHSEARCAYHINKSEIGFLVAKRAGFGTVELSLKSAPEAFYAYKWTNRFTPTVRSTVESSEVNKLINLKSEREQCKNEFHRNYISEFFIFDSKIASSLCISEFTWFSPPDNDFSAAKIFFKNNIHDPHYTTVDYLRTVIAINGNNIGNNFIIDLWPSDQTRITNMTDDETSKRLRMFEAIGVKTGALIIDFKDSSRQYFTLLDGLKFNRIHNAHAVCEYGGSTEKTFPTGNRKLSIISDFTEQLKLPTIRDVLDWLDLNESGSTQPYTAFAEAFEAAGMDSTRIKVARANRELCERASNWFLSLIEDTCPNFASPGMKNADKRQALASVENNSSTKICELASDWFLSQMARVCPDVARRRKKGAGKDTGDAQTLLPVAFASMDNISGVGNNSPRNSETPKGWNNPSAPFVTLSDFAQLLFRSGLWALADHGYRPGKVLWWVTGTLIIYWLYFLFRLKVVLFLPKTSHPLSKEASTTSDKEAFTNKKRGEPAGLKNDSSNSQNDGESGGPTNESSNNQEGAESSGSTNEADDQMIGKSNENERVGTAEGLKKINLTFLFDRLIPRYRISEENYDIRKYFKWVSDSEADKIRTSVLKHPVYFWHYIEEVTDKSEHDRIEHSLLVLRLLGLVYTIFLAAAVSALIAH